MNNFNTWNVEGKKCLKRKWFYFFYSLAVLCQFGLYVKWILTLHEYCHQIKLPGLMMFLSFWHNKVDSMNVYTKKNICIQVNINTYSNQISCSAGWLNQNIGIKFYALAWKSIQIYHSGWMKVLEAMKICERNIKII